MDRKAELVRIGDADDGYLDGRVGDGAGESVCGHLEVEGSKIEI
jgi:hypothetical protein